MITHLFAPIESLPKVQKEILPSTKNSVRAAQWHACNSCYAITYTCTYTRTHRVPGGQNKTRWLWPCSSFLCCPNPSPRKPKSLSFNSPIHKFDFIAHHHPVCACVACQKQFTPVRQRGRMIKREKGRKEDKLTRNVGTSMSHCPKLFFSCFKLHNIIAKTTAIRDYVCQEISMKLPEASYMVLHSVILNMTT